MDAKLKYVIIIDPTIWDRQSNGVSLDEAADKVMGILYSFFPNLHPYTGGKKSIYIKPYRNYIYYMGILYIYDDDRTLWDEWRFVKHIREDEDVIKDKPLIITLEELEKMSNTPDIGDIIDMYYGDNINESEEDELTIWYSDLLNEFIKFKKGDLLYFKKGMSMTLILSEGSDATYESGGTKIDVEFLKHGHPDFDDDDYMLFKISDGSFGWECVDEDGLDHIEKYGGSVHDKCWYIPARHIEYYKIKY